MRTTPSGSVPRDTTKKMGIRPAAVRTDEERIGIRMAFVWMEGETEDLRTTIELSSWQPKYVSTGGSQMSSMLQRKGAGARRSSYTTGNGLPRLVSTTITARRRPLDSIGLLIDALSPQHLDLPSLGELVRRMRRF